MAVVVPNELLLSWWYSRDRDQPSHPTRSVPPHGNGMVLCDKALKSHGYLHTASSSAPLLHGVTFTKSIQLLPRARSWI